MEDDRLVEVQPSQDYLNESSLSDDELDNDIERKEFQVSYHISENTSKRGKVKLFDTAGYEYNVHRKVATVTTGTWRCSVRNKKKKCGVLVKIGETKEIKICSGRRASSLPFTKKWSKASDSS